MDQQQTTADKRHAALVSLIRFATHRSADAPRIVGMLGVADNVKKIKPSTRVYFMYPKGQLYDITKDFAFATGLRYDPSTRLITGATLETVWKKMGDLQEIIPVQLVRNLPGHRITD